MSSPDGETVLLRKVTLRSGCPPFTGNPDGRDAETAWREARKAKSGRLRAKVISMVI